MATTYGSNIPNSVRDIYSQEIIYNATPRLRFAQFAKRKDDFNNRPGGTIRYSKYGSITRGGKLTEGVPLSEKALSDAEISISLDEYGNAVSVSEKALRLAMHDELGEAARALAEDYSIVLDTAIRDAALSTTNFAYPGGKTAANQLVSGDSFSGDQIKDAVEQLDNNNAPKIAGQYYVCIATPHQLRQLRDDPDWVEAHKYTSPENIWEGEVGMFEGVRFISTTQMPANTAGTSLTKYGINIPTWEATIFGENAFAWAVGTDVEMRDNGIEDYGRKVGIAWYAIMGFGLIEEKNIFTLLSA
jgi:N4-gp56 family major capsid protein